MVVFGFRTAGSSDRGPVVIVLVLEKESLDRMKEGDPFDIQFARYRGQLPILYPLSKVDLVIAYEEDLNVVMRFHRARDLAGLLHYLERGRRQMPGDAVPPVLFAKA